MSSIFRSLFVVLTGILILVQNSTGQEKANVQSSSENWSHDDAGRRADKFNDPEKCDPGYRKQDMKFLSIQRKQNYFLKMPFPFSAAFPAPRYDRGDSFGSFRYDGLRCENPEVPKPYVLAGAAVNRYVDKEKIPAGSEYKDVLEVEPLMYVVAAGPMQLENVEVSALSRSCPNFFFQGGFTNKHGDVDWVAIRTGSGKEIGIVNGRVLDLSLGNLILVRQHKDGSIRINQIRDRLKPSTTTILHEAISKAFTSNELKRFFNDSHQWVEHSAPEFEKTPLGNTSSWTKEQLSIHADNYNDPHFWRKKSLDDDVKELKRPLSAKLEAMPFPWVAFPIPYYLYNDPHYSGLSVGPVRCPKPMKAIACSMNRPVDKDEIPEGKTWVDVLVTNPLLYLVADGPSPINNIEQWAISRSHPHYLFQGSFDSKHGQIDWVAIRMQDGTELAIINGRIIELSHGNLILVRQEENGFINIFQNRTRLKAGKPENITTQFQKILDTKQSKTFLAGNEATEND